MFGTVLSICGEHTEARERFSQAHSLTTFHAGRIQTQRDWITGILEAEGLLRRIYQEPANVGFKHRFEYLNRLWVSANFAEPFPSLVDEEERNRILSWGWDTDTILDRIRQHAKGRRKDAWWTSRYFFVKMRAEAFRCVALSGSTQHERLMESRGDGCPSSILTMVELLDQMQRVMRTDTFIVARGCHQALIAYEAIRLGNGNGNGSTFRVMPIHLRARLDREVQSLREALHIAGTTIESVNNLGTTASSSVTSYVSAAIDRLSVV